MIQFIIIEFHVSHQCDALSIDAFNAVLCRWHLGHCVAFCFLVLCNIRIVIKPVNIHIAKLYLIEKISNVESILPDNSLKQHLLKLYSFQNGLQKSALEIKIFNTSAHSDSCCLLFSKGSTTPPDIYLICRFNRWGEWTNVTQSSE